VFTGLRRRANELADRQIRRVQQNHDLLKRLQLLVDAGYRELTEDGSLERFAGLVHESWLVKSELDNAIANEQIRCLYRTGLEAGAWGGKLLGAGGGGFLLFIVPPERRAAVRDALGGAAELQIGINAPGSHIIHG
jgi:D-glycero-alpha-D-manno-heptose-7-phosphate kinase